MSEPVKYNFGYICERDIDTLLINAFASDPGFLKLFTEKIDILKGKECTVLDIELSKTDVRYGESDVTVRILCEGEKYGLLVEDKVGAEVQPEQYERYLERVNLGISKGNYIDAFVFLFAGKVYVDKNEYAKIKYKNQVTFESAIQYFSLKDDELSILRAQQLNQALEYVKKPYQKVVDTTASDNWIRFRDRYESVSDMHKPVLKSKEVQDKSHKGDWPTFNTCLNLKEVYIHCKPNKKSGACVDLTFSGMADHQNELCEFVMSRGIDFQEYGISCAPAGKAAVLTHPTDSFDFQKDFDSQEKIVEDHIHWIMKLNELAGKLGREETKTLLERCTGKEIK